MPQRIQLSRQRGWRKPEGAVVVSRPSRWGNPFKIGDRYVSRTAFHDCPYPEDDDRPLGTFQHAAWSPWPAWTEVVAVVRDAQHATELFRDHIAYESDGLWEPAYIRAELGGHDLCCWCALPEPGERDWCHGAVLLELSSQEGGEVDASAS